MAGNASVGDLFSKLQECTWRGIGFPIAHLRTKVSQDLVVHARPDKDGARVEATGRRPIMVSGLAIFRNGIVPGKVETWGKAGGALYPDVFNRFMAACANRTTGEFQHPLRGKFDVKCVSAESVLDANRRDGEDVAVEWIETLEDANDANDPFNQVNPLGAAIAAAADLDAALKRSNLKPPPVDADPDAKKESFEAAITKVSTVVDQASLVSRQIGGKVTRVLYRLDKIQDSVERAADVQGWPVTQAALRLREKARDLQLFLLRNAKPTRIFMTQEDTTVGELASRLAQDPADILKLNPVITGILVVPPGIPIRYYAI